MEKKAIISVSSKQENKDDAIEVVTPGKFYKKEESYYVEYKETEISGMEGTNTTFKMNNDNFSLIRIGSTNANMDFKKNKKSLSVYDTPYGTMDIKIKTNKLEVNLNEKGGDVFIDYNLSISGQDYENTQLKININAQS